MSDAEDGKQKVCSSRRILTRVCARANAARRLCTVRYSKETRERESERRNNNRVSVGLPAVQFGRRKQGGWRRCRGEAGQWLRQGECLRGNGEEGWGVQRVLWATGNMSDRITAAAMSRSVRRDDACVCVCGTNR
jgi:hypothetical protein